MKVLIDFFSIIFCILFFSLTLVNGIALLLTIANRYSFLDKCNEPMARIEYLIPAKKLGCWLGEVPNDPRNENKPYIIRHTRD